MQINKINNASFGAHLDSNTRNWLFTTRTFDRVNTVELEELMLDTYKDRYIRTTDDKDGIVDIRIKPATYPIIGIDDIVIFQQPKGTLLSEIVEPVTANLLKIREERDDWQKQYDADPRH